MFANKKLALGCTLAAVVAIAIFTPSARAVVGIGNGHNHHHHHNHNHFRPQFKPHFNPNFQPVIRVPVTTPVQFVYCVNVRQPTRYGDGGFHQVKCFNSFDQADRFADSLRNRFSGEPGFVVRIDRQRR